LPISLKLVEEKVLTWPQLITKMSYAPAKVFNLPGGSLKPGNLADITIIDPNLSYKIDVNQFYSKGRNCPFHGWEVKGKVIMTIISGNIVYQSLEKQQK